jgi:hypothetical protein
MRRALRIHRQMANLAASQYGIVTRAQLDGLGYTESMVDAALRTGRLQAWHRNVFAVGHGGLSPHGLCMAAVLFRGKGALISHQSAIWLWGLEKKLEIPVNVSVRRRAHRPGAIGLHRCPALRDEDSARTERLPVTAIPRTLLDYAAIAKTYRLEAAIDRADHLELLDPAAIDRITEEVRGHHGSSRLRRAMAIYRESGLTRSAGEKRLLVALDEAGVRPPSVNDFVAGHEVDFYWDRERLAVELDSPERRGSPSSLEEDQKRREELATAGIETIRITGTRLKHEPREVADRVGALLDRRSDGALAA